MDEPASTSRPLTKKEMFGQRPDSDDTVPLTDTGVGDGDGEGGGNGDGDGDGLGEGVGGGGASCVTVYG